MCSTGDNITFDGCTVTVGTDFNTQDFITSTSFNVDKKCFFCENQSIDVLDYNGRELHLCSTHRDAIKGRLGGTEYIPYTPYTPCCPVDYHLEAGVID